MSANAFRVGQRVVIVRSDFAHRIGEVCTVTGAPKPVEYGDDPCHWHPGELSPGTLLYPLDARPSRPGGIIAYPASHLEPLPSDSHEKASWSDMPEWVRRACEVKERA